MIDRVVQLFFFAGALFVAIPPLPSEANVQPSVLPSLIWASVLYGAFLGIEFKFGRPLWQCIAIFLIFEAFVFCLFHGQTLF